MPIATADIVSRRTGEYKRRLMRLAPEVRREARRGYRHFFRRDPFHPHLQGTMVRDLEINETVYRVRVGYHHRALALVERRGEATWFIWYWIGTHEDYERRLP